MDRATRTKWLQYKSDVELKFHNIPTQLPDFLNYLEGSGTWDDPYLFPVSDLFNFQTVYNRDIKEWRALQGKVFLNPLFDYKYMYYIGDDCPMSSNPDHKNTMVVHLDKESDCEFYSQTWDWTYKPLTFTAEEIKAFKQQEKEDRIKREKDYYRYMHECYNQPRTWVDKTVDVLDILFPLLGMVTMGVMLLSPFIMLIMGLCARNSDGLMAGLIGFVISGAVELGFIIKYRQEERELRRPREENPKPPV